MTGIAAPRTRGSKPPRPAGRAPERARSGETAARRLDARLARLTTLEERIREIVRAVPGRLVFTTSLGLEDQAVLHAIVAADAPIEAVFLDTGRHFPETLDVLEESERHFGVKIRLLAPEAAETEALVARDGVFGFRSSIEARKACCEVRKVRPLARALADARGWVTGMRREQSASRGAVPFAGWEEARGLVKVNPLADWSLERLDAYVAANAIPVNALHAKGFPSIGCQPCTRAIRPGEDIRAGRWWWENEDGKECGLHNRPVPAPANFQS